MIRNSKGTKGYTEKCPPPSPIPFQFPSLVATDVTGVLRNFPEIGFLFKKFIALSIYSVLSFPSFYTKETISPLYECICHNLTSPTLAGIYDY